MPRLRLFLITFVGGLLIVCVVGVIAYQFPAVKQRVDWRVDELRTRIAYWLNPPEEAVFVPEQQSTRAPTAAPTATEAGLPTPTPTSTPRPIPESFTLEGIKYEHQHERWNYCSPANLSMALTFWGWEGNRDIVAQYTKPNDKDKNVSLPEMVEFVQTQTPYGAVHRAGGDLELLMKLIANGFPVVAEKGYWEFDFNRNYAWLGHYQFVTGYDQAQEILIVQDTYVAEGENHEFAFDAFVEGWRSFNFEFLVVYPLDREQELLNLLGPYADEDWAYRHALEIAQDDSQTLSDVHEFFAWFNIGTNHVRLREYVDAAFAYDYAFSLYAQLLDHQRPYRMLWYQTGPYWAYYYSARYEDVEQLANNTLFATISEPVLEESFYWRGLAREALGDLEGAIFDWWVCLDLHPDWDPAIYQLQRVGAFD